MLGVGGTPCGVSTSLNNRHGIFPAMRSCDAGDFFVGANEF